METPGQYSWGRHHWPSTDDWPADVPADPIMTCSQCGVILDHEDDGWHQEYEVPWKAPIFCGLCVVHADMTQGTECACGQKLASYYDEPMTTRQIAWHYAAP